MYGAVRASKTKPASIALVAGGPQSGHYPLGDALEQVFDWYNDEHAYSDLPNFLPSNLYSDSDGFIFKLPDSTLTTFVPSAGNLNNRPRYVVDFWRYHRNHQYYIKLAKDPCIRDTHLYSGILCGGPNTNWYDETATFPAATTNPVRNPLNYDTYWPAPNRIYEDFFLDLEDNFIAGNIYKAFYDQYFVDGLTLKPSLPYFRFGLYKEGSYKHYEQLGSVASPLDYHSFPSGVAQSLVDDVLYSGVLSYSNAPWSGLFFTSAGIKREAGFGYRDNSVGGISPGPHSAVTLRGTYMAYSGTAIIPPFNHYVQADVCFMCNVSTVNYFEVWPMKPGFFLGEDGANNIPNFPSSNSLRNLFAIDTSEVKLAISGGFYEATYPLNQKTLPPKVLFGGFPALGIGYNKIDEGYYSDLGQTRQVGYSFINTSGYLGTNLFNIFNFETPSYSVANINEFITSLGGTQLYDTTGLLGMNYPTADTTTLFNTYSDKNAMIFHHGYTSEIAYGDVAGLFDVDDLRVHPIKQVQDNFVIYPTQGNSISTGICYGNFTAYLNDISGQMGGYTHKVSGLYGSIGLGYEIYA